MAKFTVIAKKASHWEVVDGKQKRISKARFDAILSQKIVKTEYKENETVYHVEEEEEVELFSFYELPKTTQNAVINENRYTLVEYDDWYQYQKEDFHQILELLGFYNQGDGASFTATWDAKHIVNNPEKWESTTAYEHFAPFMDKLRKIGGFAEVERISGYRYVHEYTCVTCADDNPELESALERLRVDCCTKYYRNLRDEYDYLTSDDSIRDYLFGCYWLKYTKHGLCVNN